MPSPDKLITGLIELEPIKTWSLIVTLFGDLDGEALTGKQLREFLDPLGIKPEALRVALHRLKKDDWINSEKTGREMIYRLSSKGQKETAAAYRDVFRQDVKYPDGWRLLLVKDETAARSASQPLIQISKEVYLQPRETGFSHSVAISAEIETDPIPHWFEEQIVLGDTLELAAGLHRLAAEFDALSFNMSKQDRITVRLLLLHRWRKMALRPACWAHIGLVPDGALAQCHRTITRILANSVRTCVAVT